MMSTCNPSRICVSLKVQKHASQGCERRTSVSKKPKFSDPLSGLSFFEQFWNSSMIELGLIILGFIIWVLETKQILQHNKPAAYDDFEEKARHDEVKETFSVSDFSSGSSVIPKHFRQDALSRVRFLNPRKFGDSSTESNGETERIFGMLATKEEDEFWLCKKRSISSESVSNDATKIKSWLRVPNLDTMSLTPDALQHKVSRSCNLRNAIRNQITRPSMNSCSIRMKQHKKKKKKTRRKKRNRKAKRIVSRSNVSAEAIIAVSKGIQLDSSAFFRHSSDETHSVHEKSPLRFPRPKQLRLVEYSSPTSSSGYLLASPRKQSTCMNYVTPQQKIIDWTKDTSRQITLENLLDKSPPSSIQCSCSQRLNKILTWNKIFANPDKICLKLEDRESHTFESTNYAPTARIPRSSFELDWSSECKRSPLFNDSLIRTGKKIFTITKCASPTAFQFSNNKEKWQQRRSQLVERSKKCISMRLLSPRDSSEVLPLDMDSDTAADHVQPERLFNILT